MGKREGKSTHGTWKSKAAELFGPVIGFNVPHWKEISYVNKSIEDNLADDIEFAKELHDILNGKFVNKDFEPSFSKTWGQFCGLIAGLETLLGAKPEKLSTARTLASGHIQEDKKAQTLWFSLLNMEFLKDPEF